MKNLRIAQIVDTLDAGGYERVAVDLANALVTRGIRSFLCATRRGGMLEGGLDKDVTYFCVGRNSTFDLSGIIRFRKWVARERIGIVHAHGNSSAMFCAIALAGIAVKIIHHDHNPLLERRNKYREIFTLKHRVSAWICVSDKILDWVNTVVNYKGAVVIANPINQRRFISNDRITGDKIKIIQLANYKPHKDHSNMVNAIGLVAGAHHSFVVHCYGGNYDSVYREEIDTLIAEKGLGDRIKLHPSYADIPVLLSQSSVGILTSDAEGLPISLLEYLASGLPVIVTDVGECGSIIEKSSAGFLVPPNDHIALAEAITRMLEGMDQWRSFERNGKEYIHQHHSIDKYVVDIEKIYLSIHE